MPIATTSGPGIPWNRAGPHCLSGPDGAGWLICRRSVLWRESHDPAEPFPVGWPDLWIDQPWGLFPVQDLQRLFRRDPTHVLPRLDCGAGDVRTYHHVVERHQGMVMRRGLVLPNIQTGSGDLLFPEGLCQGV